MSFGRAIFGDNQFLGIHHGDPAKAAALEARFSNPDEILTVLAAAYDAGLRDFMFTTHDRYIPVFAEIRRSNLFPGLQFSPCLPYAHKFADAMADKGLGAVLWSRLRGTNPLRLPSAMIGAALGNYAGMMRLLTEIELKLCRDLPLRGVFLQNILFDLLLAMQADRLIADYDAHIRRMGAVPGYVTMNHPRAAEFLCDHIGLDQPWICANLNQAGFRTNPGLAAVQASFAAKRSRNIAMSVFAAGSDLRFVQSQTGVDAVLFGASNPNHIRQNAALLL